ncbi:MAG: ferredoxin-NADP reductase [Rhodospirillales bacterium]|jgi:ferredoxin--NADP+ reductase|nr:ferredoxin-NADP reductase [Rhodospirillales bacterium]
MYAVDALLKGVPGSRVDVFDRVPTPFGLIRFGVAPDHYKTRNTARQFARTFELDDVRYLGNVEIGRDLSIIELQDNYDAVVLAIGSYHDRGLGIPGEDLAGVYGACAYVGWYNGHPDYRELDPLLDGAGVAVIGIGNVALDVCRILAKTRDEMRGTDISAHALDAIQAAALEQLYMFGRRGPVEGGFTPKELSEVLELERCAVIVDPGQLPDSVEGDLETRIKGVKEKNLALLRQLAAQDKPDKQIKMTVGFYAAPVEILGDRRVEALRMERTRIVDGRAVGSGEFFEVPCCSVVTAIGYQALPPDGVPMNGSVVANQRGHVADNLYVVGWAKRGPTGTIPTNGPDSRDTVEVLIDNLESTGKPGGGAIDKLLAERGVRVVDYAGYKKISAAEIARAPEGHPQEKFTRIDEMLALLDGA